MDDNDQGAISNESEDQNPDTTNPSPPINESEYADILDRLDEQVKEARELLTLLKPLTSNAALYKGIFESLTKEFRTIRGEITQAKSANTKYEKSLDKEKQKLATQMEEIRARIADVKSSLEELKRIQNRAKGRMDTIENLKKESDESKKKITGLKQSASGLLKGMESFYGSAQKLLEKIQVNKKSSDEILVILTQANKQASENAKELLRFFKEGKKNFEKISTTNKQVSLLHHEAKDKNETIVKWFNGLFGRKGVKDEIDETREKMKSLQIQIEDQLSIAASNRLCQMFKNKVDALEPDIENWRNRTIRLAYAILIINIILTFSSEILTVIFFLLSKTDLNVDQLDALGNKLDLWAHLSIVSPLVFLLIFSALEYAKVKRYYEEYTFKYIAAYAMPAYFELIETRNEEASLKYIIDTTKSIYKNPAEKIHGNEKSKNNILDYLSDALNGIFSKKKLDVNQIMEEVLSETIENFISKNKGKKEEGKG